MIFHDITTIPPMDIGVECEFNKSGRVITWTQSRLNAGTISEIMFKKFFIRNDDVISE